MVVGKEPRAVVVRHSSFLVQYSCTAYHLLFNMTSRPFEQAPSVKWARVGVQKNRRGKLEAIEHQLKAGVPDRESRSREGSPSKRQRTGSRSPVKGNTAAPYITQDENEPSSDIHHDFTDNSEAFVVCYPLALSCATSC
jgi:hypothetical protein